MVGSIKFLLATALAATAIFPVADSGRVLMMPSMVHKSHKMVFLRLAEELIQQGHEVVMWQAWLKKDELPAPKGLEQRHWIVKVPEKHFFLWDINNMFLYENSTLYNLVWDEDMTELGRRGAAWLFANRVCDVVLETRKAEFLKMVDEHFDVVIIDDLYNPCGLLYAGLSRKLFIYWSQTSLRPEIAWSNHSPNQPSYIPVPGTGYTDDMNFPQRTVNFVAYLKALYLHHFVVQKRIDNMFRRHFPDAKLEMFNIERNASLNLINTPPVFDFPRPFMPRTIWVGCLHCRKAQALSGDLAKFVDGSGDDGFLLLTTGFSVQWSRAPARILKAISGAFAKMPKVKLVWQYEGPPVTDLPANVMTVPWVPQQDLLGHPKCRGFISHGGINSVMEAMWHGVPLVGMPIFWDHYDHLLRAVDRGAGFYLLKQDLTADSLVRSVKKLTGKKKYKEGAQRMSDLLQDVPYTELEHAVYWVRFAIKHQEIPMARSGADELYLYQYLLIDVFVFLLVCLLLFVITVVYVCRFARRACAACCGSSSSEEHLKGVAKVVGKEKKKN